MESAPGLKGRMRPALLVLVVGAGVYANTLSAGLVWDDIPVVEKNPAVQSLSGIPRLFASPYFTDANAGDRAYRPVTMASLAVDRALGGGRPWVFHLTNAMLHGLASALFFLVLLQFLSSRRWAFAAALLFAVHPVHTDAVASIVQRAEPLCAIGCFAALWAAARGRWVLCAAAFAFGLLSKETAIVLPLLLVAGRILTPDRLRPGLKTWVPLAVVVAAYLAVRWSVLGSVAGTRPAFESATLGTRILTMTWVAATYARLLVWPWPLCADYAVNTNVHVHVTRAADPRFWIAAPVLGALLALWIAAVRRRSPLAFWGAWIAIALLPVSNVAIPIGTIMAERVLYLPSAGACVLLAALFDRFLADWKPPTGRAAGIALVAVFGAMTLLRNPVWKDPETLLEARMADAPDNPFPFFHRAVRHYEAREYEEALELLDHAIEVCPEHVAARHLRAIVAGVRGDFAKSAADLEFLVGAQPDNWRARTNLAYAYGQIGRWPDAAREYDRVIDSGGQDSAILRISRARARIAVGDLEGAAADLESSIARFAEARVVATMELALIHARAGDREKTIQVLDRAREQGVTLEESFVSELERLLLEAGR